MKQGTKRFLWGFAVLAGFVLAIFIVLAALDYRGTCNVYNLVGPSNNYWLTNPPQTPCSFWDYLLNQSFRVLL
jgi:hypothetical protein